MVPMNRRQALLSSALTAGSIAMRSFATGIPIAILMDPRKGMASENVPVEDKAQYILLSTSGNADPSGSNTPGMYVDGIAHPTATTMAPTQLTLAGKATTAAAAWATLPQNILDRSMFFHTATYTVGHGDQTQTMQLGGAITKQEMLISFAAKQLAPVLGTVQNAPVAIGREVIMFDGRVQPVMTPAALASVLTLPAGPLANLQQLRDQTLDKLNAWYKSQGGTASKNFIDRYATSQQQLRNVSGTLLQNLATIRDNTPASQLTAALALFQMKLAPAVSVHLNWGGDNHGDANLAREATETVASLALLNNFYSQLNTLGLTDKVTFLQLNVFGRTLNRASGRDHNANHETAIAIGSGFQGGIVGGVVRGTNGDFGSTPIDSATGQSAQGGDVPFLELFSAFGKTFAAGVGIKKEYIEANITGGKIVKAALKV
jgi:hypothetical protein